MAKKMNKIEKLIAELCPEGVEWKTLGEIGKVSMCKRIFKNETLPNGDIPFYKIGTFGKQPDAFISREVFDEYRNKFSYPKKGDVLLSASGTIGRRVIYNGEPAYFQDSNIIWIDNDESKVLNKLLYYLYEILEWKTEGGTIQRLYNDNLKKIQIPIPPIPIQEDIVNILDTFTTLEAELEAELKARKKQCEYYRDELLSFGEDVEWKKLGEVAEFKYGFTDRAKNEGNIRFIRITDIDENGKLRANDSKFLNLTEKNKNYLISKGDILLARTGATYGKTMLFNEKYHAVYASFLIRIRFKEKNILPSYYWHFAQSRFYWDQANKLVGGGAQPQFNANVLKEIKFPIPPLAEQERIVAILDKFDALVNDISIGLPAELNARRKQYEYYRGKLLTFEPLEKEYANQ